MKKKLGWVIVPPAAAPAPIDPYTAIRKEFIDLLEKAQTNLTPDILNKLYPTAEVEGSSFAWTDEKYRNFGTSVLDGVNKENRKNALEGFDEDKLKRAFNILYPAVKPALLKTTEGRKKVRNQLKALFKLEEPFERADILREAAAMEKIFIGAGTPPPVPSVKEMANLGKLRKMLNLLTQPGVAAIGGASAIVAGDFSDDKSVEALFADVTPVAPEQFVNDFRDLEEVSDVAGYVRGYKSSTFRGHFPYLVDAGELDALIKGGSAEELTLAKTQLAKFVGMNVARVTHAMLATALVEFRRALGKVKKTDFAELEDKARFDALGKDLKAIEDCLTQERLEAIFDRDNPYKNFGTLVGKLNDPNKKINFLAKLEVSALYSEFNYMRNPLSITGLTDPVKIKEAKKQLVSMLGVDRNVKPSLKEVADRATLLERKLDTGFAPDQLKKMSPDASESYESLKETLGKVKTELTEDHLKLLYP